MRGEQSFYARAKHRIAMTGVIQKADPLDPAELRGRLKERFLRLWTRFWVGVRWDHISV